MALDRTDATLSEMVSLEDIETIHGLYRELGEGVDLRDAVTRRVGRGWIIRLQEEIAARGADPVEEGAV